MIIDCPIETPRLILRVLDSSDATETYLTWLRDPEVHQYLEIRFKLPESVEDLTKFIEGVNVSPNSLLLGIFTRDLGQHIGNIKLGPIIEEHARAEIGYLIGDRAFWGRGYATEAIAATCSYGMRMFHLAKITAGCYENNLGSAKALLKAGFVQNAKIDSHVVFDQRRISSLIFGFNSSEI